MSLTNKKRAIELVGRKKHEMVARKSADEDETNDELRVSDQSFNSKLSRISQESDKSSEKMIPQPRLNQIDQNEETSSCSDSFDSFSNKAQNLLHNSSGENPESKNKSQPTTFKSKNLSASKIKKSKNDIFLFGNVKFQKRQVKSSIPLQTNTNNNNTNKDSPISEKHLIELNKNFNEQSKKENVLNYLNQASKEFPLLNEKLNRPANQTPPNKVKKADSAKNVRVESKLNNAPLPTHNETPTSELGLADEVKSDRPKNFITVDTSKARSNSEVLRICINELKWTECPNGLPHQGCDIIWQSCTTHEGDQSNIAFSPHQSRINKFPCMNQLLRKGPLTQSLNIMRRLFREQYDFYPRTWFLPEQFRDFATDCHYMHEQQSKHKQRFTAFIIKPNDGSQGEGIHLINNPDDYLKLVPKKNSNKTYIVQEYIHNPFLIDGLKFDLRIYVVVVSLKPLEIHICDEGLVRFATVNYEFPDEKNLSQIFMHLTNYSLNKKNDSYKFTEKMSTSDTDPTKTAGIGSKRKLSTVFNYMEIKGYNVNRIRTAIDDLVVKTVFALMPEMKAECSFHNFKWPSNQRPSYFQILGFDILLTDTLKPILLEVNCNPSLRIDYEIESSDGRIMSLPSPIDTDIKKPLILETLKLVAPKKKLDIIEKARREEEQIEKAIKHRNSLVKQRIEERLQSAKKIQKFDIDKCPLLSKPGESYIKMFKKNFSASSLSLFNDFTRSEVTFSASANPKPVKDDFRLEAINENPKPKSCLRNIYPSTRYPNQFSHLYILENIADIFINFTICSGIKLMLHSDFRSFVRKCNLVNEKFSADNLDIIFFDLSKKWELYNRKKSNIGYSQGLCYQAFVEFFLTYSQLNFTNSSLEICLKSMLGHCKMSLKSDGGKSEYVDLNVSNEISLQFNPFKSMLPSKSEESKRGYSSTPSVFESNELSKVIQSDLNNSLAKNYLSNNLKKTKKTLFPIFFDTKA